MDNEKYIRSLVGHIPMHRPVSVLVIYKDHKVLLQKRNDNGMWALHGGGMDIGETYLETLKREIKEELNIEPINPELMGIFSGKKMYHKYDKSQDEVYALSHAFICTEYDGEINFTDGEVTNLKWFDLDDLPENIFHLNKPVLDNLKKYLETKKVIDEYLFYIILHISKKLKTNQQLPFLFLNISLDCPKQVIVD